MMWLRILFVAGIFFVLANCGVAQAPPPWYGDDFDPPGNVWADPWPKFAVYQTLDSNNNPGLLLIKGFFAVTNLKATHCSDTLTPVNNYPHWHMVNDFAADSLPLVDNYWNWKFQASTANTGCKAYGTQTSQLTHATNVTCCHNYALKPDGLCPNTGTWNYWIDPTLIPAGVPGGVQPAVPLVYKNVTTANAANGAKQFDILVYKGIYQGKNVVVHATEIRSGPDGSSKYLLNWKFHASGVYEFITTVLDTPMMTGTYPGQGGWSTKGAGDSGGPPNYNNLLNPGNIQRPNAAK